MNLIQLRYFLAACETGSYARAAHQCFTSRQNLTRAMRSLEKELGARLFTRAGNGIELTVAGAKVKERAQRIVGECDELLGLFSVDGDDDTRESLSVDGSTNFGIRRAYALQFEHPSLNVTLAERPCRTCYTEVVSGKADIAIVLCMQGEFPRCDATLVEESPICFLVSESSELAKLESLELEDILGHDLMLMSDADMVYAPLLERLGSLDSAHGGVRTMDNMAIAKDRIRKGDAVGVGETMPPGTLSRGIVAMPSADPSFVWREYVLFQAMSSKIAQIREIISCLKRS